MKKVFIFLSAAVCVVGMHFRASTNALTPPAGYTGAPGQVTCTNCHSGTINTGSGSVALSGMPAAYVPGTSYTLQINVTDASKVRFGFEMVALTAGNGQAGTFSLSNTTTTALQTLSNKTYVSHRSANSTKTWSVTWQAPATNVGPVTFYLVGNAANGNNNDSGDNIYSGNVVLNPASTNGIAEENIASLNFFPNPASGIMHLSLADKANSLKVLDISGREIFKTVRLENNSQLDVSNYPNGTYFLKVEQAKTMQLKRFIVQH